MYDYKIVRFIIIGHVNIPGFKRNSKLNLKLVKYESGTRLPIACRDYNFDGNLLLLIF